MNYFHTIMHIIYIYIYIHDDDDYGDDDGVFNTNIGILNHSVVHTIK